MMRKTVCAILAVAFFGGVYADRYYIPKLKECVMKNGQKIEAAKEKPVVIYRGISRSHLESVIYNVLAYLGEKDRKDWTRLLLLTAMTESDCGRLLKQVKGPAQGVMQTEPATERDVLRWTKQKYPDLYAKIRSLRVPAKLGVHEAQYNLSYSIALAYLEYIHRRVSPVNKSHTELAKLHKIHYNTYLGKATVKNTIKKSKDLDPWLIVEK